MPTEDISCLSYVGKILVVDDKYEGDVETAISTLIQRGIPVQYWNGKNKPPETLRNIRVVILDLDLTGKEDRASGSAFYSPAATVLNILSGPFIVIIMSIDFNDKDPQGLKDAYEEFFEPPFPGIIAEKGIHKTDDIKNPALLEQLIVEAIDKEILDIILLAECVIDRAKDIGMKELTKVEIENSTIFFVQSICKEFGEASVARELVDMFLTLVSRNVIQDKEFEKLEKSILDVCKLPEPIDRDPMLYHKLIFLHPKPTESPMTGDIYRTPNKRDAYCVNRYHEYAIVLTPQCDLAQHKTVSAQMIFAFPLIEEYIDDPEYPPYKIDHAVRDAISKYEKDDKSKTPKAFVKERYFEKHSLPSYLHTLRYFVDKVGSAPFEICFDFNNVHSVSLDDLKTWQRICRLASPHREELLHKYGTHSSRVGTPSY